MERLTKTQFQTALNVATQNGRACGALADGEWFGTATAWTMDYLCIYDANGVMVNALESRPMSTRGIYERARAIGDAFAILAAARRQSESLGI